MRARTGAAAPFKKLVLEAAARDLAGLEFAEGIPGSIGGGLLMNAGAFGGEMADGALQVSMTMATTFALAVAYLYGYRGSVISNAMMLHRIIAPIIAKC